MEEQLKNRLFGPNQPAKKHKLKKIQVVKMLIFSKEKVRSNVIDSEATSSTSSDSSNDDANERKNQESDIPKSRRTYDQFYHMDIFDEESDQSSNSSNKEGWFYQSADDKKLHEEEINLD